MASVSKIAVAKYLYLPYTGVSFLSIVPQVLESSYPSLKAMAPIANHISNLKTGKA